jgi:hypothetical protein
VSDENRDLLQYMRCFCITALLAAIGMLNGTNRNLRHCGFRCGTIVALFVRTNHKLIVHALRICF